MLSRNLDWLETWKRVEIWAVTRAILLSWKLKQLLRSLKFNSNTWYAIRTFHDVMLSKQIHLQFLPQSCWHHQVKTKRTWPKQTSNVNAANPLHPIKSHGHTMKKWKKKQNKTKNINEVNRSVVEAGNSYFLRQVIHTGPKDIHKRTDKELAKTKNFLIFAVMYRIVCGCNFNVRNKRKYYLRLWEHVKTPRTHLSIRWKRQQVMRILCSDHFNAIHWMLNTTAEQELKDLWQAIRNKVELK